MSPAPPSGTVVPLRRAAWRLSALVVIALAVRPASAVQIQPYAQVSVAPAIITIDANAGVGNYDASLTVTVGSNATYGGLVVSASPLLLSTDSSISIPAAQLQIKGPLTNNGFVSLASPVNVTGPTLPGIANIPLSLRFVMPTLPAAGTYNGVVTITVAGAP